MVMFSFLLDQLHLSILQIVCFFSCFTSCLLQLCCNFDEYYVHNMQARSVKMSFCVIFAYHMRDHLSRGAYSILVCIMDYCLNLEMAYGTV